MLAMICRLLATRCCISCSSISFCAQQLVHLALGGAPLGDVLDRQQDQCVSALSSSNTWRALSSMVRRPMPGNSCSIS